MSFSTEAGEAHLSETLVERMGNESDTLTGDIENAVAGDHGSTPGSGLQTSGMFANASNFVLRNSRFIINNYTDRDPPGQAESSSRNIPRAPPSHLTAYQHMHNIKFYSVEFNRPILEKLAIQESLHNESTTLRFKFMDKLFHSIHGIPLPTPQDVQVGDVGELLYDGRFKIRLNLYDSDQISERGDVVKTVPSLSLDAFNRDTDALVGARSMYNLVLTGSVEDGFDIIFLGEVGQPALFFDAPNAGIIDQIRDSQHVQVYLDTYGPNIYQDILDQTGENIEEGNLFLIIYTLRAAPFTIITRYRSTHTKPQSSPISLPNTEPGEVVWEFGDVTHWRRCDEVVPGSVGEVTHIQLFPLRKIPLS